MWIKSLIIRSVAALGAFPIGRLLFHVMHGNNYIRILNYHNTPSEYADGLKKQLEFYKKHFDNVTRADLDNFFQRKYFGKKPGLIISFDDGFATNYDVAATLLEQYGFTGWFFVSSGLIRPEGGHVEKNAADVQSLQKYMSRSELRDLIERGHVIGCHTHSHARLGKDLTTAQAKMEIVNSKQLLEELCGKKIDLFCWTFGTLDSYGILAALTIVEAGYNYSFLTNLKVITRSTDSFRLDRTNIEAYWPMSQVRFYLSGIMDLAYSRKRKLIEKQLYGN